jgi:hypothetical protein
MHAARISDAEAHELVMKRIETMTREEWQVWLDHVDEVFSRVEAPVSQCGSNGSHPKSR